MNLVVLAWIIAALVALAINAVLLWRLAKKFLNFGIAALNLQSAIEPLKRNPNSRRA